MEMIWKFSGEREEKSIDGMWKLRFTPSWREKIEQEILPEPRHQTVSKAGFVFIPNRALYLFQNTRKKRRIGDILSPNKDYKEILFVGCYLEFSI